MVPSCSPARSLAAAAAVPTVQTLPHPVVVVVVVKFCLTSTSATSLRRKQLPSAAAALVVRMVVPRQSVPWFPLSQVRVEEHPFSRDSVVVVVTVRPVELQQVARRMRGVVVAVVVILALLVWRVDQASSVSATVARPVVGSIPQAAPWAARLAAPV